MFLWLRAVVFLAYALLFHGAAVAAPLRIASDDWCPYVCARDDKLSGGLLVDVVARALALRGYQVEPVLLPLNRAMAEARQGKIDGVYAPPLDPRLALSTPVLHSRACFYTKAGDAWLYAGTASLRGKVVAIIDDYGYDNGAMDDDIARHRHDNKVYAVGYGVGAGARNLAKLLVGRFDIMLEHEYVMQYLLASQGQTALVRKAGCLERALPLVVGFGRDGRGTVLAKALGDGLRQMDASGEFHALLARYHLQP